LSRVGLLPSRTIRCRFEIPRSRVEPAPEFFCAGDESAALPVVPGAASNRAKAAATIIAAGFDYCGGTEGRAR
jgi:hypothetical protein